MAFSSLDSRLLGPLLATDAMRAAFSDGARLRAMAAAEAALARAQARFGAAPEGLAAAVEALDLAALDLDALGRDTALAGVPTIPFVKAIGRALPPDLEPSFHKGATTQDVLDTALVLQMRDGFALLAADLAEILAALSALAARHAETPCVARTYGQQAQPISFGFRVAVWAAGLADAAERLPAVRAAALRASLGGPAGTLAGLGPDGPAIADAFAAELRLRPAPIAWHARRAGIAEAGFWLALLIGALAKMATDVAHLASTELGEVAEPYVPGRGGSSAMPHKRNPVSSAVILAAQAAAGGHVATLLNSMAVAGERPAGLWHAEWGALPSLFGFASGALAEGRRLATGLVVDPGRMRANLDATRGLLFADAAASALAKRLGRGRAHAVVEAAAGRARDGGLTLRDALTEDEEVGRALPAEALDRIFDPTGAVRAAAGWIGRANSEVERVRTGLDATGEGG